MVACMESCELLWQSKQIGCKLLVKTDITCVHAKLVEMWPAMCTVAPN